jgi:retinol dehydrogenase-12
MPSFGNFIHTQLILRIPIPTTSFASKTVIITGANSGLGREAAKHIVGLGASKVILGCRNKTKGNKTKGEIENSLKCSPDIIEVWEVDIESPASIKNFVDQANKLRRIDVLINNAGMGSLKFQTAYGTERVMAVNLIGTFLLALQIIPKLKETAIEYSVTPHMTFVGSALYDVAKYPAKHGDDIFAWLGDEANVNQMDQ